MTPDEYAAERHYRIVERAAILAGDKPLTKEQLALVVKEVEEDMAELAAINGDLLTNEMPY